MANHHALLLNVAPKEKTSAKSKNNEKRGYGPNRPPQNKTEHIATPGVVWHSAIGNRNGQRPDVVGKDPVRHVHSVRVFGADLSSVPVPKPGARHCAARRTSLCGQAHVIVRPGARLCGFKFRARNANAEIHYWNGNPRCIRAKTEVLCE
jgi:hypothetical protein